jgi:hypothetical protein
MRWIWLFLAAALLVPTGFASAQAPLVLCIPTASGGCAPVTASNPLPTTGGGGGGGIPVQIVPTPLTVQGTMSIGTTSVTMGSGTVTLNPGSASFPAGALPQGILEVKNEGSVNITVCWLGSPCTANAWVIEPGASKTVYLAGFAGNKPSFIAASGTNNLIAFGM